MHPAWRNETWRPTPKLTTRRGEVVVTIEGKPYLLAAQQTGDGPCELFLSSGDTEHSGEQDGASVRHPICIGPLVGHDWLAIGPEESLSHLARFVEHSLSNFDVWTIVEEDAA